MGKGAVVFESAEVTELHNRIFAMQPLYKHYTIRKKFMVAVITHPQPAILIYDFERSIKPLMRTVDNGVRVIVREFYRLEEGIWLLEHVERIVADQNRKAGHDPLKAGVCAEQYKGVGGIRLDPEGRVTLRSEPAPKGNVSSINPLPVE